jgi:hypothetical protein
VSPRGRWLLGSVAALVVLLFAGQATADLLADRWWAGSIGPLEASFLSGVDLLRLTLGAAAVLIATAWYSGHLLVVHRAIGSVQISRQVANLEIREAVTPATLLPLAVGIGAALGLAAGLGTGEDWPVFALAWQGVTYGVTDPFLHRDLGDFVAQLPLWQVLHDFARLLAWSALAVAALMYVVIGALRWHGGRPALTDHARRHLGLLLAAAALVCAWGFLLDPFTAAASTEPVASVWGTIEFASHALAGAALAAAVISVLWAYRGYHLLLVAGWGILLSGAVMMPLIIPDLRDAAAQQSASPGHAMDRLAYGLTDLREETAHPDPSAAPGLPSLWTWPMIGRLATSDSQVLEAAAPARLRLGSADVPVWLALRSTPSGRASLLAIADSRTDAGAGPLSYRAGDTLAYPGLVTFARLDAAAVRPGAPRLLIDSGSVGVPAGGWFRRGVIAWALQSGRLLASTAPAARLRWHLAPRERLERLAPFASWDPPRPTLAGSRLLWVAYGYLGSAGFPGAARIRSGSSEVGSLEAGLVGVIDATTGATSIFEAPGAGPLSRSWAVITQGVIRPASEIPGEWGALIPYPARLFEAQAQVLARPSWDLGGLTGRGAADEAGSPTPSVAWEAGWGPVLVAGYQEDAAAHRVHALLIGRNTPAGRSIELLRLPEGATLPGPAASLGAWGRFPSYEQIGDSVVRGGGRLEPGPWQLMIGGGSPLAYQVWYAVGPSGHIAVPYVALAQGTRLGAGRSFAEAWDNLRGAGAPLPPGSAPMTPLDEARRWMQRADSALHAGDWEGFGRAFGALRQTLGVGIDAR